MDWVREHIQLGPLGQKYPDFDFIPEGQSHHCFPRSLPR